MGTAPQAAKAEEAKFVEAYRARFKEDPSYIAMLGYLSAQYMLDAIVKGAGSGAPSTAQTRQALRAMDQVTPIGRVAFDERGDPKHFSAVLFQTRGGKQVVVFPRERATGTPTYPAVPWTAAP
jgi:branched-chain amino acid transport system substrate-binding protein